MSAIVNEAFPTASGVDGALEFQAMKSSEVQQDLPKPELTSVPGWGNWTGDGVKVRSTPSRRELIAKRKHEQSVTNALNARKDRDLSHVIISEKHDKKAMKYLVEHIPHPFTSVEQYEKSIRTPLGPDFNTMTAFQQITKPAVIVKQGAIIKPLSNPKTATTKKQDRERAESKIKSISNSGAKNGKTENSKKKKK